MKKILSIISLALVALTASALNIPTYELKVGDNAHGSVAFMVNGNTATTAQKDAEVTVVVTPNEGWGSTYVTVQPCIQWSDIEAPNRDANTSVDIIPPFTVTPDEGVENTYSFTMPDANAKVSVHYVKLLQEAWVEDFTTDVTYVYNGREQKPVIVIKDGNYTLVEGTDYTVAYSNNINASPSDAA